MTDLGDPLCARLRLCGCKCVYMHTFKDGDMLSDMEQGQYCSGNETACT